MKCDCGKQVAKCDRYNGVLFCDYCKHYRRPVCPICTKPIRDRYFVIIDGDNAYHIDCYKQNAVQCSVCQQSINGGHWVGDHGLICESCFDPNNQCFACAKQLNSDTLLNLPDYRKLCSNCASTSVYKVDSGDVLHLEMIFKRFGCRIQRPTSYAIVDYPRLQKTFVKKDSTCLGHCIFHYSTIGEIKILKHHCIEILYGLPYLMFLSVLAHEMFHAWLIELFWQREILSIDDQDWLAESIASCVLKGRANAKFWYNRARHSRDCFQAQPKLVNSLRDKSGSEIVSFMRTFK